MILTTAIVCLGVTVFFEARGEDIAGQVAVAQVVMSRVASEHWPDTVCEVVHEGGVIRHKCQFSYHCDGKSDRPWEGKAKMQALLVASAVIAGSGHVGLRDATHYHADYVDPDWAEFLTLIAIYGRHKFYV